MQVLRLQFLQTSRSNRMPHTLISVVIGGCRLKLSIKSCLITVTQCGRMTIMGQGSKVVFSPQRLMGTRCSSPPLVSANVRPWAVQARTANLGWPLGTRPPRFGTSYSILGVREWATTTTGILGARCEGYVNNKINYIYNKLDENPAFVVYFNI